MVHNDDQYAIPNSNDIGFLIKLIHDDIDRIVNQEMRKWDLTFSQCIILTYLSNQPHDRVTQKDLQQLLGVAHPTVIGLIQRLEKKELIEVLIAPEDHRMRIVRLTEKASKTLVKLPSPGDLIETRLAGGLTEKERQELIRLLGILHRNVE